MDMPPQQVVEYRVERPSPSLLEGIARAGSLPQAARRAAEAARVRFDANGRSDLARMLPPIDLRSRSLTRADREALVIASAANREGRLGETGIVMPRGYVAERIRTSMMMQNADRDPASARAFRCQSVATAMSRLAGSFLDGGVQAADRARRAIPGEWLAECRSRLVSQAREAADRGIRRSVDPAPLRHGLDDRSGIVPEGSRYARAPIVLRASEPVSISPTPSRRVSIMPTPSLRVRIDPTPLSKGSADGDRTVAAQAAFLGGRPQGR